MSNKSIGNEYEAKCVALLKKKGYWAHIFAYSASGQPCDIVALKDDGAILIDVKHCKGNTFYPNRVEPNQMTCFMLASRCGMTREGFAIWFDADGGFRWLPYYIAESNKPFKKDDLRRLEEIL